MGGRTHRRDRVHVCVLAPQRDDLALELPHARRERALRRAPLVRRERALEHLDRPEQAPHGARVVVGVHVQPARRRRARQRRLAAAAAALAIAATAAAAGVVADATRAAAATAPAACPRGRGGRVALRPRRAQAPHRHSRELPAARRPRRHWCCGAPAAGTTTASARWRRLHGRLLKRRLRLARGKVLHQNRVAVERVGAEDALRGAAAQRGAGRGLGGRRGGPRWHCRACA
jgi:hypothetical protein